ncbi:Fe2OG dioxygenase domain-containing protein [Hyphomicrobiales bacterium]|nr:Fe2OG dioxygenase domain-containing protein [Hyphomicrobiales bacterium]CAH1670233.1 Fe2OG dioxygenase domain-containing protein [Hyphomicrobiales bacterium]
MFQNIDIDALSAAKTWTEPYRFLIAQDVLNHQSTAALMEDFPDIKVPGFFDANQLEIGARFRSFLDEIRSPEVSKIVSDKLGLDLVQKPKMITIRKLSAAKDGRIHTDGPSKIATMLFYFNPEWQEGSPAGRLRVLRSSTNFDDMAAEISPVVGSAFAFRRSDSSWHGHKPFVGERRVVQMTWLLSEQDVERKARRGRFSYFFKRLLGA